MNMIKRFVRHFINRLKNGGDVTYIRKYEKYAFNGTKCDSYEGYEAIITRFYHTIEKGLSYTNYRAGFGKANIDALISSMKNYINDGYSTDADFYQTALSVLYEYYDKNKQYGLDDRVFCKTIKELPGQKNEKGGLVYFKKPTDTLTQNFYQLMTTRHSIRHFSNSSVNTDLVKKAIQLAQYTPSACNRQGWKTRIIVNKDILKRTLDNQNGNTGFGHEIDKLLIVTSDLRYFNSERETYQAFIDGGMYAESVINALHYYGIGSIPLSAALSRDQEKNVRRLLNIEDPEILILFIGIGNYPEENQTTRSERKKVDPIVI